MYHIKNDKRSHKSCKRLYRALKELMLVEDFDYINVTDLVNKAEVGRATFYRNFDHIEDVLHYELDNRFASLYIYLRDYYSKEKVDFLSFFIIPFTKYWEEDSEIIELLIKSNRLNLLSIAFENLLRRGIEEYPNDTSIFNENLNYFIALRAGIAISFLIEWIKNKKDKSPEEIGQLLYNQMKSSVNLNMFK